MKSNMPVLAIEKRFSDIIPHVKMGYFSAEINIQPTSQKLLVEIEHTLASFRKSLAIEQISKIPQIEYTKDAYRKLGKDPSRYRPSAEALTRRILQGKDLYLINSLVDSLNLFSILTGYSIGGYDFDKIEGNIQLSIGLENEPYQAIGRGDLNIAYLPVLRDEKGAFGSPTSDSQRTMITNDTQQFLMVFFDFSQNNQLQALLEKARIHFNHFNQMKNIETLIISD